MKKSKTKINLGLFGLLMISLSMSQGWAESTGSSSLASVNDSDPNLTTTSSPVRVSGVVHVGNGDSTTRKLDDVRATVGNKSFVDDVTVTTSTRTERRRVSLGWENGVETFEERDVNITVATFCSSLNCGDVKEFENLTGSAQEVNNLLRQAAGEIIYAQNIAKEEADKKRGNLEERRDEEKQCKREVVDENDKSKDKVISKKSKKWFSCKIANLEVDEDEDQYEAFRKELGDELEELALSNDKDAQDILEDLYDNATDGDIEQYLLGMQTANSDYQRAVEMAERGDYSGILRVNNFYTQNPLNGQAPYMYETRTGKWGPFRSARTVRRSSAQIDAFDDIRLDILDQMDIVMNGDSNRVINNGRTTDMNRNCDSVGRGCRTRTSYRSMPQMDFNSALNTRGQGRNGVGRNVGGGGQVIDGQWISNQDINRYNSGGYRGRNNGNRNTGQRMPYPPQNGRFG